MSSVLIRTEPDAPFALAANRGTAYLSDGRLLTVVPRDDASGTYEFRVGAADRNSFTTGLTETDADPRYFTFCVDAADNVHVVYTKVGTKEMRYRRFTKDVGVYTWTATSSQLVGTLVASDWGRRDVDVLSDGTVVLLASRVNRTTTPDTPSVILYVRTGTTWDSTWSDGTDPLSGADAFSAMACSVARDSAGVSGGYCKIMLAYQLSATCVFKSIRVKVADGTLDQITTVKSLVPDGSYARTYGNLFSTGNNEWIFGGTHGHANGGSGKKMLCIKMSSTAVLGEATPVASNDFVGGNYYFTLPAAQVMGTGSDGRMVVFSPRIATSSAETGLYYQICRIVGNTLTWRAQGIFQKGVGAELIRAGANRNLQTRWVDVFSSRIADHKTIYSKLDAPVAPTGVLPPTGSTQTTGRPTLAAVLPASQGMVRGQWQTATDTGFTASVKTTLESEGDLRASGLTTEVASSANAMVPQGVYYLRAAAVNEFGVVGAYSSANTINVAHPPSATLMSPTGDVSVPSSFVFAWNFTDPFPDDTQSAYQVIVELNSDGSSVLDTGKVTSTTEQHAITDELDAHLDEVLRWKVKLWDADDVGGSYSGYHVFRPQEPPTVVVTNPDGSDLNNPSPFVEWTFAASAGRTQSFFQIVVAKISDPTNPVYQSERINSDDLSFQIPEPILENETDYFLAVIATDSRGIIGTGLVEFHSSWIPPESVPFTVDGWMAEVTDYVPVLWDDSERDDDFVKYRLYRREVGSTKAVLVYETDLVDDEYEFRDWTFAANVANEWALVQVGLRFSAEVESVRVWVESSPISTKYWLIHPTDSTKNLCLYHVTADGYTDEYEEETLKLINRGNKQDRGTRFGYTGSLTCSVYDREEGTGRQQRLELERLRALNEEMILRTPFGDVFKVSMSNVAIERQAGTGTQDYHIATIPYAEVQ